MCDSATESMRRLLFWYVFISCSVSFIQGLPDSKKVKRHDPETVNFGETEDQWEAKFSRSHDGYQFIAPYGVDVNHYTKVVCPVCIGVVAYHNLRSHQEARFHYTAPFAIYDAIEEHILFVESMDSGAQEDGTTAPACVSSFPVFPREGSGEGELELIVDSRDHLTTVDLDSIFVPIDVTKLDVVIGTC